MENKIRYAVSHFWLYGAGEDSFDDFSIFPANEETEQDDGFNYICKCGSEGGELNIYDTLKEAFLHSKCKVSAWHKIDITSLSDTDRECAIKLIEKAQNSKDNN